MSATDGPDHGRGSDLPRWRCRAVRAGPGSAMGRCRTRWFPAAGWRTRWTARDSSRRRPSCGSTMARGGLVAVHRRGAGSCSARGGDPVECGTPRAESRIRTPVERRLPLTDAQRGSLASKAKAIGRQTRSGIGPAMNRRQGMSWKTFLKSHPESRDPTRFLPRAGCDRVLYSGAWR